VIFFAVVNLRAAGGLFTAVNFFAAAGVFAAVSFFAAAVAGIALCDPFLGFAGHPSR
jgi:hypothetical protein